MDSNTVHSPPLWKVWKELVILLLLIGQWWLIQPFLTIAPTTTYQSSSSQVKFDTMTAPTIPNEENYTNGSNNESAIVPFEAVEENGSYGSLPKNVLDEIKAFLSINVTERPLPPKTPGAFLHVGKAGGSTLTQVHPTSYHSFALKWYESQFPDMRKKFKNYFGASTTYIHTPDFDKLPKEEKYYPEYSFYVANLRDPFSKFVSTFTYTHPRNGFVDINAGHTRKECTRYYKCFPTLESFATLLGDDPLEFKDPYIPSKKSDKFNNTEENCKDLARASMANKIRYCVDHLYWNTKTILGNVPGWRDDRNWPDTTSSISEAISAPPNHNNGNSSSSSSSSSKPTYFFAIRTEHMDRDFKKVNELLGDPHPVLLKELGGDKIRVQSVNKVDKNITAVGRKRICKALLPEYEVYLKALSRALNLSPRDQQTSLELSRKHCPELDCWLFRINVT